jgi:DNA-binding NarL/FixJ family response regulator
MIFWVLHAIETHLQFDRAGTPAGCSSGWKRAQVRCRRWPRAAVHLRRAALATDNGQVAAVKQYLAALVLHAEVDLPLQRAEALHACGGFLCRHGRPRDARAPFGQACQLAENSGAAWLADTARSDLRLAGGRRWRRTEDRDELSDAESGVAEIAAGGLTNADIARRLQLSTNTIETHLRRVYRKLGISARRELRRPERVLEPRHP